MFTILSFQDAKDSQRFNGPLWCNLSDVIAVEDEKSMKMNKIISTNVQTVLWYVSETQIVIRKIWLRSIYINRSIAPEN